MKPNFQLIILPGIALVLLLTVWFVVRTRRPAEVPSDAAAEGRKLITGVLDIIRDSGFGDEDRGWMLMQVLDPMHQEGRIRFSHEIDKEALYWKEPGRRPVLYIRAVQMKKGFLLPQIEDLAERLFHKSVHAVQKSRKVSLPEE